jgi:hypothetical protein
MNVALLLTPLLFLIMPLVMARLESRLLQNDHGLTATTRRAGRSESP